MAKKIVLATHGAFSTSPTGLGQTLENLFDGYPKENILICSSKRPAGTFELLKSVTYDCPFFENRYVSRLLPKKLFNIYFRKVIVPRVTKKINRFKPDLLIIANMDYEPAVIIDNALKKASIPLCVYLLDNLLITHNDQLDNLYQGLMKKANNHVFISIYMARINIAMFTSIKHWMVVHNPVAETEIAQHITINNNKEISIAYAGSIWQMHSDALFAFAAGISLLRERGMKIKLIVYTTKNFYEVNRQKFGKFEIVYGGFIPFSKLKSSLLQHNALLVASSFEDEMKMLSSNSVQTKITDYLACGIPVLSIGPEYAACNRFIEEHKVGFCIKTHEPSAIAEAIKTFLYENPNDMRKLAENGLQLINAKYKKVKIQTDFYKFLDECQ